MSCFNIFECFCRHLHINLCVACLLFVNVLMIYKVYFGFPWYLSWYRICLQWRRAWFYSWVRKIPWRRNKLLTVVFLASLGGLDSKKSACNTGDLGLIPGLERSPEEGSGNPFQYSCLENPMHSESWGATVHGVAKNQIQLNN